MFKGWIGEQKTELSLWFSLDKKLYRRFHDVIIPSSNGTTQIDHILVSPFGLFIVETKNKSDGYSSKDGKRSVKTDEQMVYKGNMSKKNSTKSMFHPKSFNGDRFC